MFVLKPSGMQKVLKGIKSILQQKIKTFMSWDFFRGAFFLIGIFFFCKLFLMSIEAFTKKVKFSSLF